MALIIRKRIKMAMISFLVLTGLLFSFTTYSIITPFSEYPIEFVVTNLMYILALLGIAWYYTFDYILHNLFSKQAVVIESKVIHKFHIKNAISMAIWTMSLMWSALLFVALTLNEQVYLEHYPIYIIVFGLFYGIMSLTRVLWKRKSQWWVYDFLFALFIKFTVSVITSTLYLLIFKII